eukprot:TRINITY_DN4308_c0_g1_i1.p1 TRINITY_DN4308_c0_g1~~TRINITY_DN4308_c0_g1_i1.p1  ORF type:complete len:254 (+),score=48.43 TRINITY_DN4308_c0_g1_i1:54-764(+)
MGDAPPTCTYDELVKLYRVRQTCIEMLEDRGYVVTESQKVESVDDFKNRFFNVTSDDQVWAKKENLQLYAEKDEEELADDTEADKLEKSKNRSIMVFFVSTAKLTGKNIKDYYEMLEAEVRGCSRAIIVSPSLPTAQCKQAIAAANDAGKIFEHFLESELLINVSKHELVPQHIPLSDREKRNLLLALKIDQSQLPRIQHADPLARHFGLTAGNVVKIVRPSDTAGEYATYRLVQA